ncbi:hypothetical protein BD779DRAFT_1524748 [Infundibulicybe gibba]|nr:hypothetical protein BD779DRAFT_1524748 [Infundibulicybe gibba]
MGWFWVDDPPCQESDSFLPSARNNASGTYRSISAHVGMLARRVLCARTDLNGELIGHILMHHLLLYFWRLLCPPFNSAHVHHGSEFTRLPASLAFLSSIFWKIISQERPFRLCLSGTSHPHTPLGRLKILSIPTEDICDQHCGHFLYCGRLSGKHRGLFLDILATMPMCGREPNSTGSQQSIARYPVQVSGTCQKRISCYLFRASSVHLYQNRGLGCPLFF